MHDVRPEARTVDRSEPLQEHAISRRTLLAYLGASALPPQACARLTPSRRTTESGTHEPLHYANLEEVARRISSRELSPVELTRHMFDRIALVDGRLEIYARLCARWSRLCQKEPGQ